MSGAKLAIVAPNCFRGTLSQQTIANAIADGIRQRRPDWAVEEVPLADGGDGTLDVCRGALSLDTIIVSTVDAFGEYINVECGVSNQEFVLVEAANIVGLKIQGERTLSPLSTSSFGLGLLLRKLLDLGYRRFVLGLGGSSIIDAGAGCLRALGAKLMDREKRELRGDMAGLVHLHDIDISGLDIRLKEAQITLACDTDLPLHSALKTFGIQKGLNVGDMKLAETSLAHWVDRLSKAVGQDKSNANFSACNGGVAYALMSVGSNPAEYGADWVVKATGLDRLIGKASVLITGEGRLDRQTLSGKLPYRLALIAQSFGIPLIAVVAHAAPDLPSELAGAFTKIVDLSEIHGNRESLFTVEDLQAAGSYLTAFL